jgi:hypothetical protein
MKVKCIKNKRITNWLTIGKTYELIIQNKLFYQIIDNTGDRRYYPKEYFKPLSEIRNERIDKLLK